MRSVTESAALSARTLAPTTSAITTTSATIPMTELVGGGLGGYSNTAEGKVIVAAFTDSYNNLVRAVRNYKAQEVQGGLGTGGGLGVQGGSTPASKKIKSK